jgi:hypothetical protein
MSYEAWRISYQSSEQAARAAYQALQQRPKVRVVGNTQGDWYWVYIGEELVFEGHSVQWRDLLNALQVSWEYHEVDGETYDP